MRVKPLAFESLGVRSMSTLVEVDDLSIVIDPSVSLAPNRFGFPPHPVEIEAREALWERIKEHVNQSDVLVVTHYHFDHFNKDEPEIYRGKKVLLKHPKRMINRGQRNRAANFLSLLKEKDVDIEYADSRSFKVGDAEVQFSAPVPHGSTAQRGYVIEVCVKAGGVFLQTSDVQGPLLNEQVEFILQEEPDLLYVDGPSSYLGYPEMQYELRDANENLVKIVKAGWIDRLVVDHHLTRDLKYREKIEPVLKAGAEVGVAVECAAEFLNLKPNLLEARRRELYKANGDDFDAG